MKICFKRPLVCNRYAIFRTDIEPCGFKTIMLDGYLTDEAVAEVRRVLTDEAYRRDIVEHNYEVGRHFFSYDILKHELRSIFRKPSAAAGWETAAEAPQLSIGPTLMANQPTQHGSLVRLRGSRYVENSQWSLPSMSRFLRRKARGFDCRTHRFPVRGGV